ncbi:cytochrome P450 [Stachybotrys elegans]|uniref:Bifunctional cytochrome P450/NADPH--P450 reductase n=1 Tax=Stachybotrys elegans TaxID=80388 RepID=A0A8K0WUC3_9HYPO|nr:cytochrome P450 [Stachybotrys elegans]
MTECPASPGAQASTLSEPGCPAMETNGLLAPETTSEEVIDHSKLLPIPTPPHKHYFGMLGHLADLDRTLPVRSYWQFMDQYAPIFQMDLGMTYPRVFVGSRELVNEMADDSRFTKFTHRLHQEMRAVFGDGLFSAESTDKAWWKAHRLLVPALGPIGLSKMFDDMQDIAAQLVLKWDRFGPEHEIEEPHPFEKQLRESIIESGRRANRPDLLNQLYYYKDEEHRQQNIVKMRALCSKIIQERIDKPRPDANDLLNVMIHGVDGVTGETMGFDNVIYQIPTLLGGGYETTSSTLCFIWYFLTSNPETLRKAQQEVDELVGDKVLTYDILRKLKYLDACMKEALRLQHPVSLLTRFSTRDTVIGGKYFIKKGQMVSGIWRHFHRDPKVWGEDADEFRPERMLDVNMQKMPPNSWKPFGDGLRACIGRGFAEQEILITMAMVLQRFDVRKSDPDYNLELRGQMGVKPVDFKIMVRRRENRSWTIGIPGGNAATGTDKSLQPRVSNGVKKTINGTGNGPAIQMRASIIWGGNQGTCESLAQSLVRNAPEFGIEISDVMDLDSAVDKLPTDRPCIIITPSYEGRPPYNGKKFVDWIEKMAREGKRLPEGVKFTVFGAGNSDWVHSFHRIPKLIDEKLLQLGAERIFEPGFANVKRDAFGPWETWSEKLCMSLTGIEKQDIPDRIGVDVRIESNESDASAPVLETERLNKGVVVASREIADTSIGPAKRHVEVQLPAGMDYRSGDYLVVQGRNADETVFRVLKRFSLHPEDLMTVQSSKKAHLPTEPISVEHFLRSRVELAVPVTKKQVGVLASWANDGSPEFEQLKKFYSDDKYQEILDKRYSIIDILEEVPKLYLPFGVYIDLLPALTPRVYSISSSPLDPTSISKDGLIASITFDVFETPALSGHGTFRGVASSYLASRSIGDTISCLIRPNKGPFQLPPSTATPVIMIAAGSGIAPMRAFLQERALVKRAGQKKLGPAMLFFGCRHPEKDYIYRSELEAWESEGLAQVFTCFSRPDNGQKARHAHHALWEQRDAVWELFLRGARVYVCGSAGRLGRSTSETWRKIWMDKTGGDESEAFTWFEDIKNIQYIPDVY